MRTEKWFIVGVLEAVWRGELSPAESKQESRNRDAASFGSRSSCGDLRRAVCGVAQVALPARLATRSRQN